MPVWILFIIMLVTGALGGCVNYLLPANRSDNAGKAKQSVYIRPLWQCILLGVGATLLVPLFLELAQSKLLDPVCIRCTTSLPDSALVVRDTLLVHHVTDSAGITIRTDTQYHAAAVPPRVMPATAPADYGKAYLLFAAYCFLAAAAGFRFINMLIRNVVKEEEVNTLRTENNTLRQRKQLQEQADRLLAQQEEAGIARQLTTFKNILTPKSQPVPTISGSLFPVIQPVTHPDDPQKGRFGGQASSHGRQLQATVTEAGVPGLFYVQLRVESTGTGKPLDEEVIFYLHHTIRPSVVTVVPDKGIAETAPLLTYRAFTAGAVTDNGETLLELDLAEQPALPRAFREA